MAKIKFGMMMTDARGKLGGQVFSKNRSGAYVRTKVTPVNPRTSFQQANRALLGSLSSSWSFLTEQQRESWNSAVENWQRTNVFGDLQKPTGKNLFTGLNKNRVSLFTALSANVLPPSKTEFSPIAIGSATVASTSPFLLTIVLTSAPGSNRFFRIRATPPLSAGTTYVTNQLRTLGEAVEGDETATLIQTTAYYNRFGVASIGQSVYVEVTEVAETGELGVPVIFRATVV